MSAFPKPTVHLNGTSKSELIRQYTEVHSSLTGTLHKLREVAPHARDYYVQKDANAFNRAMAAHEARCRLLNTMRDDIADILVHIADQR